MDIDDILERIENLELDDPVDPCEQNLDKVIANLSQVQLDDPGYSAPRDEYAMEVCSI